MKNLLFTLLLLLASLPHIFGQTPTVNTFKKDSTVAWDWDNPTVALTKFRLYKSLQPPRQADGLFDTADFRDIIPPTKQFQWTNIADGLHYFAVTALVEEDGEIKESVYSNIVTLTVDTRSVPPPKTLRVLKLTAKNTGKGEAVIAWETEVSAKGIVKLFRNGKAKGNYHSPKDIKGKVRIDNLKRQAEYQFIVFLDDKKGNTFTSDLTTFKTL